MDAQHLVGHVGGPRDDVVLPGADVPDALGLFEEVVLSLELAGGPVLVDRCVDAVGQQFVLLGTDGLLQVVRHSRRDSVAGDLLASLPGKQDKREVGVVGPNGLQEGETGLAGHVEVGDDAVELLRRQALPPLGRVRRRRHRNPVVLPLQELRRQLPEIRVVVDVEDPDRAIHTHWYTSIHS